MEKEEIKAVIDSLNDEELLAELYARIKDTVAQIDGSDLTTAHLINQTALAACTHLGNLSADLRTMDYAFNCWLNEDEPKEKVKQGALDS